MRIIALRGIGETGKTTTIIHLHDDLFPTNGFNEIPGHLIRQTDIANILEKNGRRIGLTSSGDSEDALRPRLNHFRDNECELVVCACRTRGATNEILSVFSNNVYFIEKTVTTEESTEQTANEQDALEILEEINKRIQ